jgi:cytochrome bd ubiquinol oxidase subunit I
MALAAAGPLAFLANELGWLVSEFGRQPWVVYGVFRTANAITTAPGLGATFAGFTVLYLGLSAVTVWGVRRVSTGSPEPAPQTIVSVA